MHNFRAYVVKIFNELFGGRRGSNDFMSLSVNETNEVNRGRIAGEAYLAAIVIGMVRLISSLLLAQLLTR